MEVPSERASQKEANHVLSFSEECTRTRRRSQPRDSPCIGGAASAGGADGCGEALASRALRDVREGLEIRAPDLDGTGSGLDAGCLINPHGACAAANAPQPNQDEGCGLDPHGCTNGA